MSGTVVSTGTDKFKTREDCGMGAQSPAHTGVNSRLNSSEHSQGGNWCYIQRLEDYIKI